MIVNLTKISATMKGWRIMTREKMMEITEPITDIKAFGAAVKQRLEQAHPDCTVETHEATKNNNLKLTGIAIREKGCNIVPNIYLEDFFKEYKDGKPLDEICQRITEIHQKTAPTDNFDTSRIMDFSAVKEKICYRLVNAEKNAARLAEIPHRLWQDLAVVYYIPVSLEYVGGIPNIPIKNDLMGLWGVNEDMLYRHACVNTPALFPAEIMSLFGIAKSILLETETPKETLPAEVPGNMPNLYVATNDRKINGAAVLLYDGILEKFASQINGDFYILPSSIHETLFLPVPPDSDEDDMPGIVREVNTSGCVNPEEILSDNVYLYHAGDGSVTLVR